ncbi:MAG: TonB family protein [Bacteroidota bacterium]|nr:TonB family protein [Bacteroidota bacterium]
MRKLFLISTFVCTALFAQDTLSTAFRVEPVPSQPLLAEEQQNGKCSIIGSVIDQSTREPIGNAKITVLGTKFRATTSVDGQYTISTTNEGVFQLKAEAEGYEPQIMNNVYFGEGKKPGGFFTLQKTSQEPADFVQVEKMPQFIPGDNPAPSYPEEARKQKIEGMVWVKIWVDKKGSAHKAVVLKSDAEIFNQPSIDAAMKWKFSPAILKGEPVDVWVSIPFKFKLDIHKNK